MNNPSPGWKTSEFWLHVLSMAATTTGVIAGGANPITLVLGASYALASSIYTMCRTHAKVNALQVATGALQGAVSALPPSNP